MIGAQLFIVICAVVVDVNTMVAFNDTVPKTVLTVLWFPTRVPSSASQLPAWRTIIASELPF